MRHEFNIYTDHFQFYLEDKLCTEGNEACQDDYSELWNDQAIENQLAIGRSVIAVGTARFGGWTKIVVEVHKAKPAESFDLWDQVAECSVHLPSGCAVISAPESGTQSDKNTIRLSPGTYRAFVFYGNLESVLDDVGLEGDDHYRIVLWPNEQIGSRILKRAPRGASTS